MDNLKLNDCKKTIDGILQELPERNKEVLSRRFGIGNKEENSNQPETLEKIGKDFGVTRERIRQIENKGLELFKSNPQFSYLKQPLIEIKHFIDQNGGLKKEDLLEKTFSPGPDFKPYLLLILKVGGPFLFQPDSPSFYSLWKTKPEASNIAERIVGLLIEFMEKERKTFQKEEVLEIGKKEAKKSLRINIPENHILSFVEATKKIEENPFGEYGPIWWSEINPRCVRDEAYLVLKKEKTPLHFQELAKLIEEKLQRPIQVNTLHNELIKNENFVLVGRGTYGLKEWGYKDGTVREVIEEILREKGPLSKEKIIQEVQKQRLVKESTILLNLQYFQKTEEGKYRT